MTEPTILRQSLEQTQRFHSVVQMVRNGIISFALMVKNMHRCVRNGGHYQRLKGKMYAEYTNVGNANGLPVTMRIWFLDWQNTNISGYPGYEDVEAGIVKWPLSVLRIRSKDEKRLIDLASHVLDAWRGYTDEAALVFAETDGEPHNTITPIARKKGDMYELDLTLRNNVTTEEHPLGVYHPHAEYHHIKKENIGLIEVMGLAVLPARLKEEMELLAEYLVEGKNPAENEVLEKHAAWVAEFAPKYEKITKENVMDILHEEVGQVFVHVLEDAGVYKCTEEGREAFRRFLAVL